ncbi:conserved hypothetical protein [Vibrio chagasii]|nr:conserved hypothetical protein [Vibrio chagasii]CAH7028630.1 conserved hypothetical protein [Vibrio chagasii]CAH7028990.1 conserved hypothetical protein [Vibrio chagasii]CAH7399094.1 conserved hypothetical protein [Vibrio chagasii]
MGVILLNLPHTMPAHTAGIFVLIKTHGRMVIQELRSKELPDNMAEQFVENGKLISILYDWAFRSIKRNTLWLSHKR